MWWYRILKVIYIWFFAIITISTFVTAIANNAYFIWILSVIIIWFFAEIIRRIFYYILTWSFHYKFLSNNSNNDTDELKEIDKVSIITNYLLYALTFIWIFLLSIKLSLVTQQDSFVNQEYEKILWSFIWILLIWLAFWYSFYKWFRWTLSWNIDNNSKKFFKWIIWIVIIFLAYWLIIFTNTSSNKEEFKNDIEKITQISKTSTWTESLNKISQAELNDPTSKLIQEYLLEMKTAWKQYENNLKTIDILVVNNMKDPSEIKTAIGNLNKLSQFSNSYLAKKKSIREKYNTLPFEDIETEKNIELNNLINDKFSSEEDFIKSSLALYNYLLDIQDYIYINDDWKYKISDDTVLKKYNSLLEVQEIDLDNYTEKTKLAEDYLANNFN